MVRRTSATHSGVQLIGTTAIGSFRPAPTDLGVASSTTAPVDVQTWSYLAFKDPNYAVTIDWVKTNLATTDTTFTFNNGWGTNGGLHLRVSGMTFASLSKLGRERRLAAETPGT